MAEMEVITGRRRATDQEIVEKTKTIIRRFDPEKIILFGSYAFGNSGSESDLDLLIIMNTDKPSWEKSIEVTLALKHTFPIDILVKTPEEIDNRIIAGDFFLSHILENGKVLYERPRERVGQQSGR